MPELKTYNIFLSHSWSYSDAYEKLIRLLKQAPYFYFKDYSVPKDDPIHNAPNSQELYEAIKTKMAPCHVILVMAGVYATYSTWIKREIKIAKSSIMLLKSLPIALVVSNFWVTATSSTLYLSKNSIR